MYVNAFWFGVLMAIIALIVISVIVAIFKPTNHEMSIEEFVNLLDRIMSSEDDEDDDCK